MRISEQKEKYIIYTAAILLCLVMASFWLMSNIYARYTAQGSGGDSARVAKFEITEKGTVTQDFNLTIAPGETQDYQVTVTNKSEVAVTYMMDIKNKYENLPLKVKMLDENGTEIENKSKDISANDTTTYTYKLQISWPKTTEDTNDTTDYQNADYAGKTDLLEITLRAVQKD